MTLRDDYRLAWAGIEAFARERAVEAARYRIPGDLAIPEFLRREARDVGGVLVEYLGKGRDGEDVYQMPAAILKALAAAKLDEWKGGNTA
jgi:hypothetical protein